MRIRIQSERQEDYSPDVEIDHDGKVKWARDIQKGERVFGQIARQTPKTD